VQFDPRQKRRSVYASVPSGPFSLDPMQAEKFR
jgi:hypothetical protein